MDVRMKRYFVSIFYDKKFQNYIERDVECPKNEYVNQTSKVDLFLDGPIQWVMFGYQGFK